MLADKTRILIIEARFYDHLADELLKGAQDMLTAHDADYDMVTVPGALEIPGAIAYAEEGGIARPESAMTVMSLWAPSSEAKPIILRSFPTKAPGPLWISPLCGGCASEMES